MNFLRKSKINTWWVARDNDKMAFVNILDKDFIEENEDFLVVGYYEDKENREIGTSTNHVKEIRLNGVVTSKGTFYPYSDAHPLYLEFLIEANKAGTVIATNWEASKMQVIGGKPRIVADILDKDRVFKGVQFDFKPLDHGDIYLAGYSNFLKSRVVLTTFARRNVCIKIKIPDCVKEDMYNSSFVAKEEIDRRINTIQAYMTAFMES